MVLWGNSQIAALDKANSVWTRMAEMTPPGLADRLLTAGQVAERWQVPTGHVYRLAREGRIPAVRVGRYYRFRVDALERWELQDDSVAGGEERA